LCEKAEGAVRYLMFVCDEGVIFIDMNMTFWKVEEADEYHSLLFSGRPTLLDGELVRHNTTKKPIYLISDAVQVNGNYVADRILSDRLNVIGTEVLEPFEKVFQKHSGKSTYPFLLYRKKFYQKEQVTEFWKCMKEDGSKRRYYDDGKRSHRALGMIITPDDQPFCAGKSHTCFEWKFHEKYTILFRVQRHSNGLQLYAESDIGETECQQFKFPSEDTVRFQKDWETLIGPQINSALVLCAFDTSHGQWRYIKLKLNVYGAAGAAGSVPDDIITICETLTALGENITKEELIYRIPKKDPENDDWLQKSGQSHW